MSSRHRRATIVIAIAPMLIVAAPAFAGSMSRLEITSGSHPRSATAGQGSSSPVAEVGPGEDPADPFPGSSSSEDYITPDTSPDRESRQPVPPQAERCTESDGGLRVCYESRPATDSEARAVDSTPSARSRSAPARQPGDACTSASPGSWHGVNRLESCSKETVVVKFANRTADLGSATFLNLHEINTNNRKPDWNHKITTTKISYRLGYGKAAIPNYTADARRADGSTVPYLNGVSTYPAAGRTDQWVTWNQRRDAPALGKANPRNRTIWTYRVTVPNSNVTLLNVGSYRSTSIQCDRQAAQASAGCAIKDFVPTFSWKTSRFPSYARHVREAQASGLPGGPGKQALTRTVAPATIKLNRGTACPISLKRPAKKSCDEYPFATTYEGAASKSGAARSRPWCQMPDKARTGAGGFSRCFIPETENQSGGSSLGNAYINARIVDRDAFRVTFVP